MKNYKILRINSSSPCTDLFNDFYASNRLNEFSYEHALQMYSKNGYLVPGSWSLCMQNLGNHSNDVVPDFQPLQRHWAQENKFDIDLSNPDWVTQIFFAQIEHFKPDVLFFYAGGFHTISSNVRGDLKAKYPFLKIITGWWGDNCSDYANFKDLDICFCSNSYYGQCMVSKGIKVHVGGTWCFDHILGEIVERDNPDPPCHDFIFAGTSGYLFNDHRERYLDLVELMTKSNLQVWCWEPGEKSPVKRNLDRLMRKIKNISTDSLSKLEEKRITQLRKFFNGEGEESRFSRFFEDAIRKRKGLESCNWWHDKKSIRELFPSQYFPPVYGLEYYKLLKSAKVVFNRHRDEKEDYGNIRVFEVTGIGSCLLTNRGNEMADYFTPDEEIVVYSSVGEAIEKANYLLENESVRKTIANKGKVRTLKDHSVMNRCIEINDVLKQML